MLDKHQSVLARLGTSVAALAFPTGVFEVECWITGNIWSGKGEEGCHGCQGSGGGIAI